MGKCKFCGKEYKTISTVLEACRDCILHGDWNEVKSHLLNVHEQVRKQSNLPGLPPKETGNIKLSCNLCCNECQMSEKDMSYCGLRSYNKNQMNELPFPTRSKGYIHGYIDANPTNCCNSWFCPAGSSSGYPEYSNQNGPEYGTYSYAAFLYGCTFNCLFCQNWSHKNISKRYLMDVEQIVNHLINNEKITCICYFGGNPDAQFPFTIHLSELILEGLKKKGKKRKFRVCWETNGSGNSYWMEKAMKIAVKTGGNIKIDLKSFDEKLNIALCGISNNRTLENFRFLAENYFGIRNKLPELSGCTLMVPGYTNHEEVEEIARFISSIDRNIPYSLLVFRGDYQMRDLGITPINQALECFKIAKKYLNNVHLGNEFLLKF